MDQTKTERLSQAAPAKAEAPTDTFRIEDLAVGQPVTTAAPAPASTPRGASILPYCITVLTSAFLLFQVQPIIGKSILPWFGSTPGVWATCMLFFQLLLLAGYAYAHYLVKRLPLTKQAWLHGALLAVALLSLPILPDAGLKPTDADAPVGRILLVLTLTVGAPYLLLSATGPLIQGWYARVQPERSPYRLYALSNVGSLLGLISYPFLVERMLTLELQGWGWSAGFAIFAVACVYTAWLTATRAAPSEAPQPARGAAPTTEKPRLTQLALWLSLSACGSALLLATTNQLCLDVAVVPFLWVVPLCLYLITFILCFDSDRWYQRGVFFVALPLVMANAVRLLDQGIGAELWDQIIGYSLALFVGVMCMHGELARRRPAPQHLTLFFLVVSIGGAVGGLFVAVLAPMLFSGYYEFPVLALATCLGVALMATHLPREDVRLGRYTLVFAGLGALVVGVLLVMTAMQGSWLEADAGRRATARFLAWRGEYLVALAAASAGLLLLAEWSRRRRGWSLRDAYATRTGLAVLGYRSTLGLGVVALAASLVWVAREEERKHVLRDRNFYGMLAIQEYDKGSKEHRLGLKHGRIRHGTQLTRHPDWPTAYYGPRSLAGVAIRKHPERGNRARPFRVGVIGLGVGTLAAYANARIDPKRSRRNYVHANERLVPDVMEFYEINPMVLDWAEEHFTFLGDARKRGAAIENHLGDARIVLERQLEESGSKRFDVLVLDAFSGDAIPIHLLTQEALQLYWEHLTKDGILAMHVSNRFIDVKPVVVRLAKELGYEVVYAKNKDRDSRGVDGASWMIMTNNTRFLDEREVRRYERDLPEAGPLWTDDFSSIFDVIETD